MTLPVRPRDDRQDGALTGVYVAVVRDNEDPEALGRVRLEYPWRETDAESAWARIAVPMAGGERGTYFLPETGDEVLVAFEDGDIDHPYVVGALWNRRDPPPADNRDGENDVRRVASRNGHRLTFDDADDGGSVVIETAGGHRVVLDDRDGEERITIEDAAGSEIEFDGTTGDLSISSDATLAIEAAALAIESDGDLDVRAAGDLSLRGRTINLN